MSLKAKIESILFISSKPLTISDLFKFLKIDKKEIKKALEELQSDYHRICSGLQIISNNNKYQLTTAAKNSDLVQEFLQQEVSGELSQPSLETLTIIAYRGPISKTDLEKIRGVNCSLILRNLLIRGLIEELKSNSDQKIYNVTLDFLRHLGVENLEQLPNYNQLSKDQTITDYLEGSFTSDQDKEIKEEI